ncbi:MAG: hypothetical protein ABFQ89_02215 [Chloroflexota bacterium]
MNEQIDPKRPFGICLALALLGIALVVLSIFSQELGIDPNPGFGLIHIIGILVGSTFLAGAGYMFIARRRRKGEQISLISDIGLRMGMTGLLALYVSGLADWLGVGTHRDELFDDAWFGPLQFVGFSIGVAIILAGMLLFWYGGRMKAARSAD